MGKKKLLAKLGRFLSGEGPADEKRLDELKHVLKKLKKKEKKLIKELEETDPDSELHKDLETKIDILHAQRKKGLGMLK